MYELSNFPLCSGHSYFSIFYSTLFLLFHVFIQIKPLSRLWDMFFPVRRLLYNFFFFLSRTYILFSQDTFLLFCDFFGALMPLCQ